MKIPNKRELQQRFLKIILQNHILFLVNDTALPSDNPLRFRKNLFGINIKKIDEN